MRSALQATPVFDVDELLALHRTLFGTTRMDAGDDDKPDDDDKDGKDDDKPGDDDDADEDLDAGGKKALNAERARARKEKRLRTAAEKKTADLEKRLADLESAGASDNEKAVAKAKAEATDEARKEAAVTSARRIVRAEVKAAAGGKLADPADAVRLLDLDEFDVDDDGEVDTKAIAAAIDELLESKPYLAAKGGKPAGDADGGARGKGSGGKGKHDMNELLRQSVRGG